LAVFESSVFEDTTTTLRRFAATRIRVRLRIVTEEPGASAPS
jgi:hypothetical protein